MSVVMSYKQTNVFRVVWYGRACFVWKPTRKLRKWRNEEV